LNKSSLLGSVCARSFSIVTPPARLHLIDHPRYGKVYPIACFDFSRSYFTIPCLGFGAVSIMNTVLLYASFVNQIFTPMVASFVCNPVFLLPSLWYNQALFQRNYVYFFGARSHVQNMYLLPNGKQVYVETRDGLTKLIDNSKFYEPKPYSSRYESRLDFGHGANNYLFMRGNATVYDEFVLDAVLTNNFIDVNNVAYDYDVTSEFTWDFRELVEIKKRKRMVTKIYKPTVAVLSKMASARHWQRCKQLKITQNNKEVVKDYKFYEFHEDPFINNTENILPGESGEVIAPMKPEAILRMKLQNEANVNNGGRIDLAK
jgi:hypothetical protein